THIGALLPTPAAFDFGVATKSLVATLADLFGAHSAGIGEAAFDRAFSVKASDVARVAALFDAEARQALLAVEKEGLHPAVDPHAIHLRRFSQGGLFDSEQMIESDFRNGARLAKIIGASFARAQR